MARNEEKAQSMLYRFREAQAAELGLGTRGDKRPKMASACKSLRECERWRGEILREISRKVSKIQDSGLTDYEVRDVNDEINKLLREKRHWENQIISLGGANYRRNVAMLDDDGKEVPGTKGYKYFGRAKDLPGVRELFQSRKKEEEEENQALAYYKKFMHQGPAYFGDLDETQSGNELIDYEREAEEAEWREAQRRIREALEIPTDDPIPDLPRCPKQPTTITPSDTLSDASSTTGGAKRKADGNANMASEEDPSPENTKRPKSSKTDVTQQAVIPTPAPTSMQAHAQLAASHISFLSTEDLLPPKMPTREEMEGVLLQLQKEALVNEYFGDP
ncbi:Isy1-like splicing factor [Boletus reticuloceps]|uniref:Isy1-like splicing factor n=1 Tax=Boletus reticuloceps TaxID=495285 RepID=A0A8I2YYQ7_9AGAM|nr:Isy1-like splicing factor [Boletus reticuloceps]